MEVAAMRRDILKLCADSLRTLASERYGAKLKASHAHELVAAFFGYRSKNALLADKKHPVSALGEAEVFVMIPVAFFNSRRMDLEGLSLDLPEDSVLCEEILRALLANQFWNSAYLPFQDYDNLARFLIGNSHQYDAAFPFHRELKLHHFVAVESEESGIRLTIVHACDPLNDATLAVGRTVISLPRVAGHTGFGVPKLMPERWTAGMRRPLSALGLQP
jgi:hypothetical protein